jgi:hypothetical protein
MRATASDMTISPPVATPCSRDAVFTTSPIAVKSENPDRQRHAAHGRLLETGLTPARVLSRRAFARTSHQPAAESRERAATGLTPRGRREPGEDPYSPTHRGVPEVIEEARPFLRVGLRIFGAGWRALMRHPPFSHHLPCCCPFRRSPESWRCTCFDAGLGLGEQFLFCSQSSSRNCPALHLRV